MFKKVVVGISGGIDSAVACLFLKNKGFNVTGCFMKNWDIRDETGNCQGEQDYEDAKWICKKLDVPLIPVNFVKEYWIDVFSYTIESYSNGETPNPDIQCNRNIKFNKFYHFARQELKADAIATGHYVCTSFGPFLEYFNENENVRLLQAKDPSKDQTFFLSQVSQESLQRCMFPLGNYMKKDVKRIAFDNNLKSIVDKKESMGICFIGKRKFRYFISEYIEDKPGNFIDLETGKVMEKHEGQHIWTIGQNIKIAPYAYYLCVKDWASNDMFVVKGTNHSTLYTDLIYTAKPYWINKEPQQLSENKIFTCYLRYQHLWSVIKCIIYKTFNNDLIILLEKPQRAITVGQYAVFYLNNECLGSAKISNIGPSMFALKPIQQQNENKGMLNNVKVAL